MDGCLDGKIFERTRGFAIGLERIYVFHQTGVLGCDRGVAHGYLLVALGRNGKDAHSQQVVAHVFKKPRILGPLDDLGVDLPRLCRLDHLPANFLAIHPHGELVNTGPLWHRKDVGRFELPVGVVTEGLFDLGDGHLVFHGNADAVVYHGQRWNRLFFGDQDSVGLNGSE